MARSIAKTADAAKPPAAAAAAGTLEGAVAAAVAADGHETAVQHIYVDLTAILGIADMKVSNLLKIGRGAIVELNRRVGDTVEIRCNGMPIGRGDVVVVGDHLGVSITELYHKDSLRD